jgi:hypothetical protein
MLLWLFIFLLYSCPLPIQCIKPIIISETQLAIMTLDKETIAIITASIAVLTLVGKPYIDAIYKEYPPDIKKHVSFIKKFFAFALSYILPIVIIIYLSVNTVVVTKSYVLIVSANISIVFLNIMLDVYKYFKYKIVSIVVSLHEKQKEAENIQERLIDINETTIMYSKLVQEQFNSLNNTLSKHNIFMDISCKEREIAAALFNKVNKKEQAH